MKQFLSVILSALLLCGLLSACRDEVKTMAEVQQERAESSAAERAQKKGVLRVMTDLDPIAQCSHDMRSQANNGREAFSKILQYFGGVPSGMEVELEVLPAEESDYQMALTRTRTEIMAGKGPDVFYLSCFDGDNDIYLDSLFPNPEHAMASGFFLPLDSYIANARFMEMDQLDAVVMEAGRYQGTQYILPMFYRLGMGILYREAGPDVLPASWDEAAASGEEDIRALYTWGAADSPGFRQLAFSQVADNVGEELLLDKDTLYQRMKDALDLYRSADRSAIGLYNGGWNWDYLSYLDQYKETPAREEGEELALFVPRGGDGDVTASVQHWCAVNSNTQYPEDAFFITDIFMSKEFLSATNFWNRSDTFRRIPLLGEGSRDCVPVHKEPLSTNKKEFRGGTISSSQCQALTLARESITYAYLPSNVDQELNRTYEELRGELKQGQTITDEELRRRTDQCHSTLKMMLAES